MRTSDSGRGRWRWRWRGGVRQALLLGAAVLLACAWFAPTLTWQRPRVNQVVVIDVTQSMNVVDQVLAAPSGAVGTTPSPLPRLVAVKRALREVVDTLPCGSRLGWAVFAESRSYLLLVPVEVCAHRAELRDTLAGIDGRMAWSGNSEIAKGLHSAIEIARKLPGRASLAFVTDGHEAPPLSPRHRPPFDDKPGEVAGVIVGVGALQASPIPKTDPLGRPLGLWTADEVMQTDPRSQGRGASVRGEAMAEDDLPGIAGADIGLGATPGTEHLSSLREPYLQLLARENGLAYQRLDDPQALAQALRAPAMLAAVDVPLEGRSVLGVLALALLLLRAVPLRRWRLPAPLARRRSGQAASASPKAASTR